MNSRSTPKADGLWAITSYFNPMGYKRRLFNFKIFRERLGVPLIVVELAYGSEFQLQELDADILVRLHGAAVLWQKERLLNVALQVLPEDCRYVAWLDCDIFFATRDWAQSATRMLEHFAIIQLFKSVHYLSPQWAPSKGSAAEVELTRSSAAFSVSSGVPAAIAIGHTLDKRENTSANGFALAARRELLDQHGLFDVCIIGGGDRAMNCAVTRCFQEVIKRHYMTNRQQDRYMAWAEPFSRASCGEIGYLDEDIFHLWHGDIRERRSRTRHEGLARFEFDPFVDIAIDPNGCWHWNTDKHEMHDYVRRYFLSRREDG